MRKYLRNRRLQQRLTLASVIITVSLLLLTVVGDRLVRIPLVGGTAIVAAAGAFVIVSALLWKEQLDADP